MKQPVCRRDQNFYRLIPSRFPPIDVYERLGSAALISAAQELEALTNPRLAAKRRVETDDHSKENSAKLQNWNHAPFAYKNPQGSYLLSGAHGVLEAAGDKRAALALSLIRRETFLANTNEEPTSLDMRVLVTHIKGRFADLTSLALDVPEADRWEQGRQLLEAGFSGAIFHRPEYPAAEFVAVFNPETLAASVQAEHFRFVWDGTLIKSVYDFSSDETIDRAALIPPVKQEAAE